MVASKRWCAMHKGDTSWYPMVFDNPMDEAFVRGVVATRKGWNPKRYVLWTELPVVEACTVYVRRDPAVGIADGSFGVECHLDLPSWDAQDRRTALEVFRWRLWSAFNHMEGEDWRIDVVFDFEE